MTPSTLEADFYGEPLTPAERVLAGVPVVLGVVGHALLATAAVLFLYALVSTGL